MKNRGRGNNPGRISQRHRIMTTLDNTLLVALASRLDKLADSKSLQPGTRDIHVRIVLDANLTVSKGRDVSYVPTVKLPLKNVLAVALAKAGFQRDNISALIEEAAREALAGGDMVADAILVTDEAMERVEKSLAKLPPAIRSGATKVTGEIEFVSVGELPALKIAA